MQLRKAPYTEFKRVSITLDDFSSVACFPSLMINNMTAMDMKLNENDLVSFMNPACPQSSPKRVSRSGTCTRALGMGSYSGCRNTSALSVDTTLLRGLQIEIVSGIV